MKKVFPILLSMLLLLTMTSNVPAADETQVNDIVDDINSIYAILDYLGFDVKMIMELPDKSDDFYADLDTYSQEIKDTYADLYAEVKQETPSSQEILDELIYIAESKGNAMDYAYKMAQWSINDLGWPADAINQEAVYMYLSHYIDRQGTFWDTMDPARLNDGPSVSDDGYFAKYITDYDREAFDIYMTKLEWISGNYNMSNAFISLGSLYATSHDVANTIENFTSRFGSVAVDVMRSFLNIATIVNDSRIVADYGAGVTNRLVNHWEAIQTPEDLWGYIYPSDMDLEEQLGSLATSLVMDVIVGIKNCRVNGASFAPALIAMGVDGVITTLFLGNHTVSNFFVQTAWLSLSLDRNLRIGHRFYRYLGWH